MSELAFDPERRTGAREHEKQFLGHVCCQHGHRFSIADSTDAEFLAAATRIVLDLKREGAGK